VFVGVHDRSIDEKGRLALPSSYRADLGERCVVALDNEGCLRISSESAFAQRAAELLESEKRGDLSRTRLRALTSEMTTLAVDKQGRITLDEKCRAHAGLRSSNSVKVVGMLDAVEVWRPERYAVVRGEGVEEAPPRDWGEL
jgi:MraZ protein